VLLLLLFLCLQSNTAITPLTIRASNLSSVNSGHSYRINTLADLEAALNIFANGAELAGLICGLALICHSAFPSKSDWTLPILRVKLSRRNQFFLGLGLIIIGLAIPGIINWSVAGTHCGG
jgi:hypothetical protein